MPEYHPCPLTPPLTPARAEHNRAIGRADVLVAGISLLTLPLDMELRETDLTEAKRTVEKKPIETKRQKKGPRWKDTKQPRAYVGRYQLVGSSSSGYQAYGHGAWSTVYRAVEITDHRPSSITTTTTTTTNATTTTSKTTTPPPTPPTSPSSSPVLRSLKILLAIKTPSSRSAHLILKKEAYILTYLSSLPNATHHLVAFHGYDLSQSSLVLEAVPLSLETHAIAAAKAARLNLSTKNMFDPVIGSAEWAHLATKLIDGLAFLHSARCVHGDIKPANVLLRPSSTFPFPTPLYCDFSSSHIGRRLSCTTTTSSKFVAATSEDNHDADDEFSSSDDDDGEGDQDNNKKKNKNNDGNNNTKEEGIEEEIEPVSAVTPDYASPELLSALQSGKATATQASDVFALATTLVMAAIGQSPYYSAGRMEVLKLAMAKEGRPLDFAQGGENASRVMRGKLVDKVVRGGLVRDLGGRSNVWKWKESVGGLLKEVLGG